MNKEEIISKYKKQEDAILLSKFLDKLEISEKKNQIVYTDFLNPIQINFLEKMVKTLSISNCTFYETFIGAERKCLIFNMIDSKEKINSIIKVIRVKLPSDLIGKYEHKTYLGGLIKLGIKREKIGDIIVYDEGADIIILNEVFKFVYSNIQQLKRFNKVEIEEISVENIYKKENNFLNKNIIIPSLRVDNLVSELVKTSRNRANELIKQERVILNYEVVTKNSKMIKMGDILTIRGKCKIKVKEQVGNTKSGRIILNIEEYS